MIEDSNWLRERLHNAFGHGWQTHFARFLILAGDTRPFSTIIRGISSASSGRHRLAGELRVLINLLSRHGDIPDLIKEAKRDPGEPIAKLLPKPKVSDAPPRRKYKEQTKRQPKPNDEQPKRKMGRPVGSINKEQRLTKYPWLETAVGGSFFVPNVNHHTIRGAASQFGKSHGIRCMCQAIDGGVKVTRLK